MKSLKEQELREWFDASSSTIAINQHGHLVYRAAKNFGIKVNVPADATGAVALTSVLFSPQEEFYGGILFYNEWDLGTPSIEKCGLRILEKMRNGYGVTSSIENAPAQLFRSDELVDAQAFFSLAILFGWDAFFAPHDGRYIAYSRRNASLFVITQDEHSLQALEESFGFYQPVRGLPSHLLRAV